MGAGESGAGAAGGRSGAAGRDVGADLRSPVRAAAWHDAAPVANASARAGGAAPPGEDGGEYRPSRGGSGSGIGGHAASSLRARLGDFADGVSAALFHARQLAPRAPSNDFILLTVAGTTAVLLVSNLSPTFVHPCSNP